jgi:hypothetical protein
LNVLKKLRSWCPQPQDRLSTKIKSYSKPTAIVVGTLILAISVTLIFTQYALTQSVAQAPIVKTPMENSQTSTPPMLYDHNFSVLNTGVAEVSGYNGFLDNVSQGLSLQVNITFTSKTSQQIVIPVENLKVTYYNSTVDLHRWINTNDNYSLIQQQAFNYSLSLNQLTLQPNMSNSTILKINLAQNAPLGQYSIEINIGNIKVISSNGTEESSYSGTIGLEMIVTPKTK